MDSTAPRYGSLNEATRAESTANASWRTAAANAAGALPTWEKQIISAMLYYLLGCMYYGAAETLHWDPLTVFYFTAISITTCGYGDVAPVTDRDKLFTIVYIMFGLAVVFSMIANAVDGLFASIEASSAERAKVSKTI